MSDLTEWLAQRNGDGVLVGSVVMRLTDQGCTREQAIREIHRAIAAGDVVLTDGFLLASPNH